MADGNFPGWIFFIEEGILLGGKSVYQLIAESFQWKIYNEQGLEFSQILLMKYSSQILDLPIFTFEMQLIRSYITCAQFSSNASSSNPFCPILLG